MTQTRVEDWKKQAENDLLWARHSYKGGGRPDVFHRPAGCRKMLKAYCFFKGYDIIRTHSLFQIVRSLGEDGVLENNARELDLYYISGRYPDAFPAGAPFELITKEQAQRALKASEEIFQILVERMQTAHE